GVVECGQDVGQYRAVFALSTGDHVSQRPAAAIASAVSLGGQPSSRAGDAVTCGFTVPEGPVLVIRPCPLCPAQGALYLCCADERGRWWRRPRRSSRSFRLRRHRPRSEERRGGESVEISDSCMFVTV